MPQSTSSNDPSARALGLASNSIAIAILAALVEKKVLAKDEALTLLQSVLEGAKIAQPTHLYLTATDVIEQAVELIAST